METTKLTEEPGILTVPAAGSWLITLPVGTVALQSWVTAPTENPVPVIAACASAWVRPTMFGTATCAGPVETTKLTAEPALTLVAAAGFSLITLPLATV